MNKLLLLLATCLLNVSLCLDGLSRAETHVKLFFWDNPGAERNYNALPQELKVRVVQKALLMHICNRSPENLEVVAKLTGHTGAVNVVASHPKQPTKLASGSVDGTVRIWDTCTGQSQALVGYPIPGTIAPVTLLDWRPTEPDMLAASFERCGLLRRLDVASRLSGKVGTGEYGHGLEVTSVAWHPTNPNKIISAARDARVLEWDTVTREFRELTKLHGFVFALTRHPSKPHLIAAGSSSGVVRVFDTQTERWQDFAGTCDKPVSVLAWHPKDPDLLAVGFNGGGLLVQNTATGQTQWPRYDDIGGFRFPAVSSIIWHPTHPSELIYGTAGVSVWDTHTGKVGWLFGDPDETLVSLALCGVEPIRFATGSRTGAVRLLGDPVHKALYEHFSSTHATYEQMVMALWLYMRYQEDKPTIVLDALRDMNGILGARVTSMAAWRDVQKTLPRNVLVALNRALTIRARGAREVTAAVPPQPRMCVCL